MLGGFVNVILIDSTCVTCFCQYGSGHLRATFSTFLPHFTAVSADSPCKKNHMSLLFWQVILVMHLVFLPHTSQRKHSEWVNTFSICLNSFQFTGFPKFDSNKMAWFTWLQFLKHTYVFRRVLQCSSSYTQTCSLSNTMTRELFWIVVQGKDLRAKWQWSQVFSAALWGDTLGSGQKGNG